MKPIYNSNTGRTRRPRKTQRAIGMMSYQLRKEVEKYGVTKLAVGMTLLSLGVDVVALNLR